MIFIADIVPVHGYYNIFNELRILDELVDHHYKYREILLRALPNQQEELT